MAAKLRKIMLMPTRIINFAKKKKMSQPKFIITDTGWLRLGMVNMHKDLLEPGEECLGGGYYEFDYLSSRLLLSGRSYDFGRPQWRWLDNLRVPKAYSGLRILYSSDRTWDAALDIADILPIEYC